MTHTDSMPDSAGTFDGWKSVKAEDPKFKCRICGSDDIWYRTWESSCGGYEDAKYECRGCKLTWWIEGPDA